MALLHAMSLFHAVGLRSSCLFMKRKICCDWPLLLAVALVSASALPAMGWEAQPGLVTNSLNPSRELVTKPG